MATLQETLLHNYLSESWLIAQKAQAKFAWMSAGRIFFRLALALLVVLAVSLFNEPLRFYSGSAIGLACLFIVFAYEAWRRPPVGEGRLFAALWLILAAAIAAAAIATLGRP